MPDKSLPPRDNPLSSSDAGLARVTEDLIDLLIVRGVIRFTDLPLAAQNKLLERKETRARLSNSLDLLGDDSGNETI
jgi:hypothetical protein